METVHTASPASPLTLTHHLRKKPTMNTTKLLRSLLVSGALLGATTGFAACGDGGIDKGKLKDVQKQGEALQNDAKKVQADAKQVQADIASGKITAAEGQKKLEAETNAVTDKAKKASSTAIDAVKDNKYLTDEQKQQLKDAETQLGQ
jgi:hypothetical protein